MGVTWPLELEPPTLRLACGGYCQEVLGSWSFPVVSMQFPLGLAFPWFCLFV